MRDRCIVSYLVRYNWTGNVGAVGLHLSYYFLLSLCVVFQFIDLVALQVSVYCYNDDTF